MTVENQPENPCRGIEMPELGRQACGSRRVVSLDEVRAHSVILRAGKLREMLIGMDDDAPVMMERIHDAYFEKHRWAVVLVEGHDFLREKEYAAKNGLPPVSDDLKDEYHVAQSAFRKNGALFIRGHY